MTDYCDAYNVLGKYKYNLKSLLIHLCISIVAVNLSFS